MKKSWDNAEIIAIEYIKRNWYNLIETNFKFSIFWEVDLICEYDDLTVFIEVKYRSSDKFGTAWESITKNKLFKLQKTIYYYCFWHNINLEKIRFDVITIEKLENKYRLTHFRNQALFY